MAEELTTVTIKMSDSQKRMIQRRADKIGLNVSSFMRMVAMREAVANVEENNIFSKGA